MLDYIPILLIISFAFVLAITLFLVSFITVLKNYDIEKLSSYECGFDPFQDTRSRIDVRFYLVAILFIIFDLEVVFLFPWSVALGHLDLFGLLVMYFFLFILIIGFAYEWLNGALDWE